MHPNPAAAGDQAVASAEAGDAGPHPNDVIDGDAEETQEAPKQLRRWAIILVAGLLYLVALGGGSYGIVTGFIKAATNAKYPGTRSSSFTIGAPAAWQSRFVAAALCAVRALCAPGVASRAARAARRA